MFMDQLSFLDFETFICNDVTSSLVKRQIVLTKLMLATSVKSMLLLKYVTVEWRFCLSKVFISLLSTLANFRVE